MNDVHAVELQSEVWIAPLPVNNTIVPFKLDIGAKANLISWSDVQSLKVRPKIWNKTVALKAYNGQGFETKGTCRLSIKHKNRLHHVMFTVVPDGHKTLLGDKACVDLGLVKRVYAHQ